ncbi:Uncharacterised protein [Streptococcus pneumoniae]|nr:Uncharacterised protein [Streptococcus pneumoniae]CIY13099.1 Uncharacterised protein [Streptococcus pneumoniae]CJB13928.1 Uncharacterised protein [Streptococcus pneumoniae]CJB79460.1 Uncharacterised protein [Streptococcus pneumoniae]CJM98246.1 Uncharacterised protein [Streptococcus pneumoniae]
MNQIEKNIINLLIGKKLYFVIIYGICLNGFVKFTQVFFSKVLVELLAVLGSLLTYSIAYQLSQKKSVGDASIFKMILINGLGIYIFSDPLNYLILKLSYSLNSYFMFTPVGIIVLVVLRFFLTLFISLIGTIIFKKIQMASQLGRDNSYLKS